MKKILITRDLPEIASNILVNEGFDVTAWNEERPLTQGELIEKTMRNDALLSLITDKIDAEFLHLCKHLEFISQCGAGYDNIDLVTATKLGIPVANTPDAMSQATADIAFGLMIAVSRKMFYMHKSISNGQWGYFKPKANLGMELRGKTLGIFGLGRIGVEMALRSKKAFDMNIIYCNRNPNVEAEKKLGARYVSFQDLLRLSDVLSVHSMLSKETAGIFNQAAFEKMKSNVIFINTARGLIHNEQDLTEALKSGRIWGAGLDVTNPEPMDPSSPLLFMENVAVLPHIGSATVEARTAMARSAAENMVVFFKSRQVAHLLNPAALLVKKI
jgi:glyoxylate reductase